MTHGSTTVASGSSAVEAAHPDPDPDPGPGPGPDLDPAPAPAPHPLFPLATKSYYSLQDTYDEFTD